VQLIDLELARGKGDWKAKASESLKTGLVSAIGAGVVILGLITAIAGRMILRGQEGQNVTDLIGLILTFGAVMAVAAIVAMTSGIRRIVKRCKELDAMSREDLREEAEIDKWSFCATAQDITDVSIDSHDSAGGGRSGSAARLTFTHDPTGKWKLSLLKMKDARAAARAFRQILGKDNVEVNVLLKREV
jgi:hypothetical protein